MKQHLLAVAVLLSAVAAFAQNPSAKLRTVLQKDTSFAIEGRDVSNETVSPTYDIRMERIVAAVRIEDQVYQNTALEIEVEKSDKYAKQYKGITLTVRDTATGKKIFRKHFSKSYLYGFADKTLHIGVDNTLLQMLVAKTADGQWVAEIRKEGIY
ncbi:MAG: hypothetical protein J5873_03880 [Bacteroidales bacterium]|nr:hypothetical protein [Bacteroidales bacterium]